ncbi:T9SS type B sorting domain-containing protein [Galbibacter sp. BG1]|uniref:T9SS type B sorting domain-containing protein n=1 Tax=Galbibacter sp. BG1 TaxID=1170699 RepID=UPI0015BB38CB|nr:T9SS type B sorting domain-containing protein [Galbibacter sp. BG1]QLE02038.1 T9SS type B sorting domain-containing protein [Galbibacter sp. BG1]
MFKYKIAYILLLIAGISYAQKESNVWYFGEEAGIDFNSGAAVVITDSAMDAYEGCATISDSNGKVLFYTDGIDVWNKEHRKMENGSGLNGHASSTQSGIIVPYPGKDNLYYIFTVDLEGREKGLQYSIVDMELDGGNGAITDDKNIILTTPVTEKVTSVKHADGESIWLLTHEKDSDVFLAYLITTAGLQKTPIKSSVGMNIEYTAYTPRHKVQGYLKASPDGSKVGICHFQIGAEVLDFNNSTGVLSNAKTLSDVPGENYYGIEFSPNSKLLYMTVEDYYLYQYDLTAPNIQDSQLLLLEDTVNIKYYYGALQLAPDGKIYFSRIFRPYLGVIENPNVRGAGCNPIKEGLFLEGKETNLGLPTFIQSYFYTDFTVQNLCLGDTTNFMLQNEDEIASVVWDFGDGNYSTLFNPSHNYVAPGTYTVSVDITTNAGAEETKTKEITINKLAIANKPEDISICTDDDALVVDLSLLDSEVLGAQNPDEFTVNYFSKKRDAELSIQELDKEYVNRTEKDTIYARVDVKGEQRCYDIASFTIAVSKIPQITDIADWMVCQIDLTQPYDFDLQVKAIEILDQVENPANYDLKFYTALTDANNDINELATTDYTNITQEDDIYFRLTNVNDNACYLVKSFKVGVISKPIANLPMAIFCDDDDDGLMNVALEEIDKQILGNQDAQTFEVSYYESREEAEQKTNSLGKENYINIEPFQQVVFARVDLKPESECFEILEFKIEIDRSPVKSELNDWMVCKESDVTEVSFDLSEMNASILGEQSAEDYLVSYYSSEEDAVEGINPMSNNYMMDSGSKEVFYRLEGSGNAICYLVDSFSLVVTTKPSLNPPSSEVLCYNDSNSYIIDLNGKIGELNAGDITTDYNVSFHSSFENSETGSDPLQMDYAFDGSATVYVRAQHKINPNCFELEEFELYVNPELVIPIASNQVICPENDNLVLDGGNFDTWSWKSEAGELLSSGQFFETSTTGTYQLEVSRAANGLVCNENITFQIEHPTPIGEISYNINHFSDQNEVEIEVQNPSSYLYSLDGVNYQESNIFMLPAGRFTLFVKGENGCLLEEKDIVVLGYPKFFTPNNDGLNDEWKISDLSSFPSSTIQIFDRYGKLISLLEVDEAWDGRYNGIELPESDYWFVVNVDDGTTFKGHFTLKRDLK